MDVVVAALGVASPVLDRPDDVLAPPAPPVTTFDPAALMGGRGFRYRDRATQLALLAATRAFDDATLFDGGASDGGSTVPKERCGVVASSNLGNLDTVCRTAELITADSVSATRPMDLPNASSNIIASSIAVRFGLRGPNIMVCNGASSGLDAIYLAASLILAGRVDRVVVAGVEPVNDVVAGLVGRPTHELFDGAVAVLLELGSAAAARGATPRVRLGGYSRRAEVGTSALCALDGHAPPGLWFVDRAAIAPTVLWGVPRHDLQAGVGAASGALGVLQVVAGSRWLTGNAGAAAVLATAGAERDGTSSLLLVHAGVAA